MSLIPFAGAVQKFNRSGGGGAAGYQIERSLRFNSADSAYLNRTPGSAGNRRTWTWSGWVKRSAFGGTQSLFARNDGSVASYIIWNSNNKLEFTSASGSVEAQIITTPIYRDASAWYHVIMALDTTQATSSNRVKLYINGVQVTALDTASYPSQNYDGYVNTTQIHYIGAGGFGGSLTGFFNGYLTEINFIDGSALDPTSFGEFNATTGIWQPIAYEGSYGTNGFYLNFSDNSGTTSTTLGKDQAGSNNWTPNNFSVTAGAGNDSLVDTPTPYGTDTGVGGEVRGNYATWNPLDKNSNGSLVNGNLDNSNGSQNNAGVRSTFALPSSDKWYAELRVNSNTSGTVALAFGFATASADLAGSVDSANKYVIYGSSSGSIFSNTSTITSGLGAFSSGDILQIAYDGATGKAWLGKNNTWYNSSGGTTGDPGAGANQTFTLTGQFFLYSYYYNVSGSLNAGQRPFAYTAPSGFKALCTQNLPEPTIVDGSEYFDTLLWTGNGSNPRTLSGLNFAADMIWHKSRSNASMSSHAIQDAVRGFNTNNNLYTNLNASETDFQNRGVINSVSATGFTFNNNASDYSTADGLNENTQTFVAWNWKAGNSNVTNTDGTITSTVRANPTAGFSIVTYTGDSTDNNGTAGTVGHGLGIAPSFIMFKPLDTYDGCVYHSGLTSASYRLVLFSSSGGLTESSDTGFFNGTAPTSTVFSVGTRKHSNSNGGMVAYCFAPVAGYSAFGRYVGNNSDDGPFIYTGFRPAFFIAKDTNTSGSWMIIDNKRPPPGYNVIDDWLIANSSVAEQSSNQADFTSNGIKLRAANATAGPNNVSGNIYIYMAFAENPFKYALAR